MGCNSLFGQDAQRIQGEDTSRGGRHDISDIVKFEEEEDTHRGDGGERVNRNEAQSPSFNYGVKPRG